MKIRRIKNTVLAFTLILSVLLSSLVFAVSANEVADTQVWDGTTAENFAGGDGSASTPYLIENGAQLRLMITSYMGADYEGKNFKITKDIYLNDVKNGTPVKNLADKLNWLEDVAAPSKANSFYGILDGDGHTIYGLYAYGEKQSLGLIPAINSATVVKNLNFDNLYLRGAESWGGAIAGQAIYYAWQKTASISNCSVTGAVIGEAGSGEFEFAAGFVGDAQSVKINFTNCYSYNNSFADWTTGAGIVANDWNDGSTAYNSCYSIGYYPVSASVNKATINSVYTNVAAPEGTVATGIVTLTDDQMKGNAAKTNMAGFDFIGTWQTTNDYPVLRDEMIPVWDGTTDKNLEGSGTEADPYLIKTAAQLAAIVTGNNGGAWTGKYFKLANDIRINDTNSENWKDTARNWVWVDFRFIGTFDGDGHTIDGFYNKSGQRVMGLFSYVGADNNGTYKTTLKNFKMTNAYVETDAADGAGFAAGQASRVAYFDGIYIDDTCEINSTVKGAGGILGQSGYNVFMSNIAMNGKITAGSNVGAFVGTLSSGARLDIKSSYTTADLYAQGVTDRNLATASGAVYVVKKQGTVDAAATLLTADQMKGENAKTYMTSFSFKYIWETVENDYPIYNPRGELWDGTYVSDFSTFKGAGTPESPYLIENGAQLAFAMVKNPALNAGTCYKLANDIILNDTSFDGWEASARPWLHQTANRWVGVLDGDGHTIEGLYMNTATKRPGLVSYSQGTFKNLVFSGASINYTGASEPGVAIIAAQTSGPTNFENIYIDETCEINATAVKGVAALAGRGYDASGHVVITNCAVLATINTEGTECGALAGSHWVSGMTMKINNSFSATNLPLFGYANKALTADSGNNYSVVADERGTTVLTADQMKGEAAKTNMSGLDFDFLWKTTNGYPVLRDMDDRLPGWNGGTVTSLKGEGTKANPYKISNGAELYYAISTYSNGEITAPAATKTYFEITADINLNGQQWYVPAVSSWLTNAAYNTIGFNGVIYGNGHTIYNLYSNTVAGAAGLIPVATQGTEIYDLHLKNGNLPRKDYRSYALGGLIGLAKGQASSTPITISGCSVDNYTIAGVNGAAGLVGYTYSQSVLIKDSYVVNSSFVIDAGNASAFIGKMDGSEYGNSFVIENSYTDTFAVPIMNDNFAAVTTFNNVFTTDETYDNTKNGLTKVTAAQLTGATAKNTLKGFNFNQFWATVDGSTPVHTTFEYRAKYFTGEAADGFASGTGTLDDPYVITTADELYLLATLDRTETLGKYYKLGNDITISNVYTNWQNDAPHTWAVKKAYLDGFTYTSSFAGTLDGAGYTVYGLYYNNAIVDGGNYAYGVIPFVSADAVIKNITVSDTYAVVSGDGAYVGAVAGAAHVMKEDIEADYLHAVQFVGVNVTKATIGAANKGDILGGGSYGVKFEICSTQGNVHGNLLGYVVERNCNNSTAYRKDVVAANSITVNDATLETIRKVLIGNDKTTYMVNLDTSADFNICDLVAAKRSMVAEDPEEYLVWSDEFNGTALNGSVWTESSSMSAGTKLEYANTKTFDGTSMSLNCYDTGKRDESGNPIYNINKGLNTINTMSYKYGRLEMRAKIPVGAGAFPALWLSSRDAIGYDVNSEFSTEVDVFEVFGKTKNESTAVACIHKWYNEDGVKIGEECSCGTGVLAGNGYKVEESDRSTEITYEWCTVVFEWTEDTMTFSINGEVYYTARRSEMDYFDKTGYDTNSDGVFNQFMYPILTNYMYATGEGASYAYDGSASEILANLGNLTYEIDYIRLYQKNDGKSAINLQ